MEDKNITPNNFDIAICQIKREIEKLINDTEATLLIHDGKIAELTKYIKDNLDNSIRTLLDSMLLSGDLERVITDVIVNCLNQKIFFVNTATGFKYSLYQDGDVIKTLGYSEASDGGSALYKVRPIKESDTEDKGFIHVLGSGNVAELIVENEVNIKQLGAIGDGKTDSTNIFKMCIEKGINKIIVPEGNYVISEALELNENTEIVGTNYRACTISFTETGAFNFTGTSILNNGKHKKYLTIRGIELQNIDKTERTTPFLNLICCDYVKIIDSWIYGIGKQILMWECFDSRFTNTDIEWGGSYSKTDIYGIELKSGDGFEYTNNIYFNGCRFESHVGSCIGTTGENNNKITFTNCKFESYNCLNNKHINITKSANVYFIGCFFAGDLGNSHHCVYLDQVYDFEINGFIEHSSIAGNTYKNKEFLYASGSGKKTINITLNNKDKYKIDDVTYGIATYGSSLYDTGFVKVNNFDNKSRIVSSEKTSVATLKKGDTELNYKCTNHGYIYVTMTGEYGKTDIQSINILNSTKNYNLRMNTTGAKYVTGFMPVEKGDVIKCSSNTSFEAYVTFISI